MTRFQCVECGHVSAGHMPRGGDTTARFPRRHYLKDGQYCRGNSRAAAWIEVRPADKPRRKHITAQQRMEIVYLRRTKGWTLQAIATKFERTASGIGYVCEQAMAGRGAIYHSAEYRRRAREWRNQEIYEFRNSSGHSLRDAAQEFGVSRARILQICREVEDAR